MEKEKIGCNDFNATKILRLKLTNNRALMAFFLDLVLALGFVDFNKIKIFSKWGTKFGFRPLCPPPFHKNMLLCLHEILLMC